MSDKQSCGNCKYYTKTNYDWGICGFTPPSLNNKGETEWVETKSVLYCREWKGKENE